MVNPCILHAPVFASGMSLEFVHISKRNNAASMLYSARNHAVQHRCSEAVVETRKMQQWWCGCETHPSSYVQSIC